MKKLFLLSLAAGLSCGLSHAQLSAFVNGKEIKNGAIITQKDLESMQVSFKKPKDVTVISGWSVLSVDLRNTKKQSIQEWYYMKKGYTAINDFLKTTPAQKKFKVFDGEEFTSRGNTLDWILKEAMGQESQKTIQVKVSLYVQEETGYQEYGPRVELLEPLVFNMPMWETKKLYLPYLDLTLDKTNFADDFDLKQTGPLDRKSTEIGYRISKDQDRRYAIFALSSDDYPGLNATELGNDFLHDATIFSNAERKEFKNYDISKYELPWDNINDIEASHVSKWRFHSLNARITKDIRKMDMLTLLQPVEINGLKGYAFRDDVDLRSHINATDWKKVGTFVIYFLQHPTNPKLTLAVSSLMYGNGLTTEQTEAALKELVQSFKKGA